MMLAARVGEPPRAVDEAGYRVDQEGALAAVGGQRVAARGAGQLLKQRRQRDARQVGALRRAPRAGEGVVAAVPVESEDGGGVLPLETTGNRGRPRRPPFPPNG
jgi:hypothetical protein